MPVPARRALGIFLRTMTAAAALVGAIGCSPERAPEDQNGVGRLVLVFGHEEPDATMLPLNERAELREAAASLTVSALSEPSTVALANEIHRWHVLVDIAHNPLSADLEDDDLEARMKTTSGELAPRLTAATSLLGGIWRADDGLTVRVARQCPSGARCVLLSTAPGDDRTEARARFLAWPLASALHVRLAHRDRVAAVANALRRELDKPSSAVSLVVDGASLAKTSPAARQVQVEAQELQTALGPRAPAKQKALIASFAARVAPQTVAPWLSLGDDDIMVVPRLSYLGRMAELVAEVRRLLAQLDEPGATLLAPDALSETQYVE